MIKGITLVFEGELSEKAKLKLKKWEEDRLKSIEKLKEQYLKTQK